MQNYDVKKERKDIYGGRARDFEVVDVPPLSFLMVDGCGDPNTASIYPEAIEALYASSYAVRALAKASLSRVHTVGPLEGLWWAEDLEVFRARDKSAWSWTLMIVQPAPTTTRGRRWSACTGSFFPQAASSPRGTIMRSTSLMPAGLSRHGSGPSCGSL